MSENDVQQVEVVEPVEVRGHHVILNGYRWITIGYALLAVGMFLGLFFGFHNDRNLQHEVTARCHVSEQSRSVLREEHTDKLRVAQRRLDDTKQFLNGRPIPAGFTREDIVKAIKNAEEDVAIEKRLLRRVQPIPCK